MDALTAAALDTLLKEALPALAAELEALAEQSAGARRPSAALTAALREAIELLKPLAAWSTADGEHGEVAGNFELSDDEALALLAGAEGLDFEPATAPAARATPTAAAPAAKGAATAAAPAAKGAATAAAPAAKGAATAAAPAAKGAATAAAPAAKGVRPKHRRPPRRRRRPRRTTT